MNLNNIINSNKRQFTNTMKKEGMVVFDYYDTSKTYTVFFRRNNRSTSPEGKLRLFYEQDTDIKIGTVFVLRDIPYVVVSQDGIESDVYYTSMAIRCDTYFTVYSNTAKGYMKIPFVTMTDKYTISSNSTISIISGTVVIYTGLNDHVKDMAINNGYYNYGGYYKVGNYFYNNDIAYLYLTREAMPTDNEYVLTFNGEVSIDMSTMDKYQLSYEAIYNGTIIDNPTLTYVSSNTDVATVDENGLLTIISTGETTITATWTDGNDTTCSTVITVIDGEDNNEDDTPTVTMAITGKTSLKYGFSSTYKAVYSDADNNDVSANYTTVWSLASDDFDISEISVEENGNKISLLCENKDLVGYTFTLTASDADRLFTPASIEITLVGLI